MAQMPISPNIECPNPLLPPRGVPAVERVAVDDVRTQLVVTFYHPILLPQQAYLFDPRSYSLTGGQRLFPRVLRAEPYHLASPPDFELRRVLLTLDGLGDFSVYTLTVNGPDIDPFFSSAKLRFRLACDDPFDCRLPIPEAPPEPELPVAIDYLAKDYAGFRQALLDFIPTRLPAWTERSEADIGMMLLELFSATADSLSYMQDRVAHEAFLNSATQRRSVAGHLALIGYQMDEGASAYTWLQFQLRVGEVHTLPDSPAFKVSNRPSSDADPVIVFETLGKATLDHRHNAMFLYDWNNQDCCLPRGEHSAALVGSFDGLQAGDYLLFDDGRGHRDVVRLISPPQIIQAEEVTSPPVGSPPVGVPHPGLTIVHWSDATPLRHDYCVAEVTVRGNMVPATHGETIVEEALRDLSPEQAQLLNAEIAARRPGQRPPRQRLRLAKGPLAHLDPGVWNLAAPLAPTPSQTVQTAAAIFTAREPRSVSTLTVKVDDERWQELPSLLESRPAAQVFRVEIDDQGDATVVFGDDTFGRRPPETAKVTATYRVGGGSVGNVGADALTLPHSEAPWLLSVTNPLPAVGGRDLESREHARRVGPPTSHTPLVAVSAADYQAAVQAFTNADGQQPIQRANATFRWTGSWLTVTLAVDPRSAQGLTPELERQLLNYLETRRLAGYDIEIVGAVDLPVDLAIEFCVAPGFRAPDVQQALQQALSNADLPDGGTGFFHPDNFSFGDNLYVSQIYAAVMSVPGVESAQITRLARLHAADPAGETVKNLRQGFLAVGTDQIIRLDNDRNFPENGVLTIRPRGAG